MNNLLLNGEVPMQRCENCNSLEHENDQLQIEVQALKAQLQLAKREAARSVHNLRQVLSPLHNALKQVFGEMDAIGGTESAAPSSSKWESVKQRLQPRHREVIDLLLIQGTMGRKQIAAALKMDYSNCTKNVISILVRQGWLIDNGRDGVSLKEL